MWHTAVVLVHCHGPQLFDVCRHHVERFREFYEHHCYGDR